METTWVGRHKEQGNNMVEGNIHISPDNRKIYVEFIFKIENYNSHIVS